MKVSALRLALAGCLLATCWPGSGAALRPADPGVAHLQPSAAQDIIQRAVAAQLAIGAANGIKPLAYFIRKVDARGETLRYVLNTTSGPVTRLVERDGKPLLPEEQGDERGRLTAMLDDPRIMERTQKRNAATREDSAALIRALPAALLFTPVQDAPERAGATGPEEVFDFAPNPQYRPTTLETEALTGIEGRIWIDSRSGQMAHLEGRFRSAVNFGFGLLARIYPGGTVVFDQVALPDGHFVFRHLDAHLTLRELMVRTQVENTRLDYFGYTPLATALTWQQGVQRLLQGAVPPH